PCCSACCRSRRQNCCRSGVRLRWRSSRDESQRSIVTPAKARIMETRVMSAAQWLLATAPAVPLVMLVACLGRRGGRLAPILLAIAPMPALVTAILVPDGTTVILPRALFGLTLMLDRPGAMLLGAAALLWIAAGAFVAASSDSRLHGGRFATWW